MSCQTSETANGDLFDITGRAQRELKTGNQPSFTGTFFFSNSDCFNEMFAM